MNVAIVVNCLKTGGMERVAVNLADAFYDAGHQTDLIYLKDRKREIEPKNTKIPVHLFNLKRLVFSTGIGAIWFFIAKVLNIFLSKTFPIWFAYTEAIAFRKKLKSLEKHNGKPFDLIIFRGQGTFEHVWPIQDPRFVYVCENVQNKYMYGKLSQWVHTQFFHRRNVICVSQGALDSFVDMAETHQVKPNKVLVVNNPNDFTHIRTAAQNVPSALHYKPYILGLGRLVPQKNFTLLVQAYDYAIKKYAIPQDLVIVGEGNDRTNIEAEVQRLQLNDRVHFKGLQTNPFPWYQQADLYVLSSRHEGLGMVLIEALTCKTKVVCTDSRGGVRQIMKDHLEPFLAQETASDLGDKIAFALNFDWNDQFDLKIQKTLEQFDGGKIVSTYLKEFYIS